MNKINRACISSLVYLVINLGANLSVPSQAQDEKVHEERLCPGFILRGKLSPGFSDTEKRLICGDSKTDDAVGMAWKEIPLNQAKFDLKTFLQDRAFYHPTFQEKPLIGTGENKSLWIVDLGQPTRVKEVKLVGDPPELRFERRRGLIGELLTPKFLGSQEQWVSQRLQAEGYGCPVIGSKGDSDTGSVTITIDAGTKQDLIEVIEDPIEGLTPGMVRRYDAFHLGETFNGDLLAITNHRVLAQGLLQSVHYTLKCNPNGITAKQESIAGLPRLLRFGVGIDTEALVNLRAAWNNTRFGKQGSLIDVSGLASKQEQRVDTSFTWYNLPFSSRRYMKPFFELRHTNLEKVEQLSSRGQYSFGTSWDTNRLGAAVRSGPTLDYYRTYRGVGPTNSHFLSLENEVRVFSHYYEFFKSSPRTGFQMTLLTDFNAKGVFSDASGQRLNLSGEGLWNIKDYDPFLLILGVRGGLATTLTGEPIGNNTGLPADFRYYLGGAGDIRGFGRQEISGPTASGGFSSAFADFEARLGSILPLGIQPFAFLDLGSLGSKSLDIDSTIYWSPGLGLRWESPVGSLRTNFAHGFLTSPTGTAKSHFQFYFSFGEEF